jgi:hypothetical protein
MPAHLYDNTTYQMTDLIPGSKFRTPAGWFVVPEGVTQMLITVSITGGASAVGKGGGKTWPDIRPTKEEPQ